MRFRLGLVIGLVAVLAAACYSPYDFDGSGKTNLVWWNYTTNQWQQYDPAAPTTPKVLATAISAGSEGWAGDFDGDGRYELGILEPEQPWLPAAISWPMGHVALNMPPHSPGSPWSGACNCATTNSLPVFGAYTGGHKTLPAWYQSYDATWTISGQLPFTFGRPQHGGGLPDWDVPVPGDYDGDGTTEAAVYNPVNGEWTVRRDGQPVVIAMFGGQGALPLAADWDGDGATDPAYATGTEIHVFNKPTITVPPGVLDTGIPILGDYDGDGRIEPGALDFSNPSGSVWITTVHDGEGPDAPLRIDQSLRIGNNSSPAPILSTVSLTVDIARLSYLHGCLAGGQTC